MRIRVCLAVAAWFVAAPLPAAAAPSASARARAREVRYLNKFLAARNLPPAGMAAGVQSRGGWVHELDHQKFVVARRLGEREAAHAVPSAEGRGELVWLRYAQGAWQAESPGRPQRPPAPVLYFQSHPIPVKWAAALKLDAKKIHYFTVLHCELTPENSEEVNSPLVWELPAWFKNAAALEKEFAAGRLIR